MKLSSVEHAWLPEPPKSWQVVPAWSLFAEGTEGFHASDPHLIPSRLHGVVTQEQYSELTGLRTMSNDVAALVMKHVDPNDFVISMGSHETGIEHSPIAGKVSNDYRVLKPSELVIPAYFRWFFKSRPLIEGLAGLTNEIRVGQRIHYSKFATLWLPLPSPDVQQRIADYLDRETGEIDAMIATMDELAGQLEARRKAEAAAKLLPFGLPADLTSGQGFRELGYTNITPLSSILERRRERNEDHSAQYLSLMKDVGVIRYEDKGNVGNKKPEDLTRTMRVVAGDYLINSMNFYIGSFGISPHDGVCSSVYLVFNANRSQLNQDYLSHLFASDELRERIQDLGNGILEHRRSVSWDSFSAVRVPLPSLIEQEEVVKELNLVRARTQEMLAKVAELKSLLTERRAALITDVVTGRKEVA